MVPVFYASQLAAKALRVYQTFINMMNKHISRRADLANPFEFQFIRNIRDASSLDEVGPCVVMASPGMLQSGLSRRLFERWCDDEMNGLVLAGYSVQGTLGFELLSQPKSISCLGSLFSVHLINSSYQSIPFLHLFIYLSASSAHSDLS